MNKTTQIIIAASIWLCIAGFFAAIYKYVVAPHFETVKQQIKEETHKQTIVQTGSESRYKVQLNFAFDSFSGYAPLRSEEFINELAAKRIKVNFADDGADYNARLKSLASGDTQIAAFTIDALVKASAGLGDLPATIVALIDETRGADAVVGYKSAFPNIDSLNNANVKFVLTPNSPSETLARVIIAHFGLNNLGPNPFIEAKDAEDVYKQYREAKPADQRVFVLWEPYVSKILENPNTQVLVDSSRFRGYIVDVLVCNRDFLLKNEDTVTDFVEAYLRTIYKFSQKNAMSLLVSEDSRKAGTPLTDLQTKRLVEGIWWKNTSENYAHMGLNSDRPLQNVEDMLLNITKVLIDTDGISSDPTKHQPNLLYYNKILGKLQNNNFHPGIEDVREDSDILPSLNDEEWKKLVPVGTLQIPTLVFARGRSSVTEQSAAILDDLIEKLKSWPFYYVTITSNVLSANPNEADRELAKERGQAIMDYMAKGVSPSRMKVFVGTKKESSVTIGLSYQVY